MMRPPCGGSNDARPRLTENYGFPFDDLVTTNDLFHGAVKLLNGSLPREASGDHPRADLSAGFDDGFGS